MLRQKVIQGIAWFNLFVVIVICMDVVLRYFLSSSQVWMTDLAWYIMGIMYLGWGVIALMDDRHVRVDVLYERLRLYQKQVIQVTGHILLGIPWVVVVLYSSWHYACFSLKWLEGSPDPNGLGGRYIIKFCMVLGFAFLGLGMIYQLCRTVRFKR